MRRVGKYFHTGWILRLLLLAWLMPVGISASEDGTGNRLGDELSPYLRLHAHNPVDWYPWGEEALQKARRENRPIFLSIGYSTCYWCHVMERQVFSDPEIAALMNDWFVNIKVDREERPDLDQIYMTATQLLSGHAGWPNSVFLTPDLQPFFAGTYFPPEDSFSRPGFPTVLRQLRDAWELRRAEVLKVAARVTEAVRELEAGQQAPPMPPDSVLVNRALAGIGGRYDYLNGGFGGAPKFPPCVRLEFLLAAEARWREERFARIVTHTLRAMARGGIHDQVGGGFHRYAVDAEWRVPHFEKMLYSQAHLARLYARGYQATGDAEWRRVAAGIFAFVAREMTAENGAFYTALDAETDGVEGAYYLWTEEEIEAVLGADSELFFELFGLEAVADGEGGAIYASRSVEEAAAELGVEPQALRERARGMRSRLAEVRAGRDRPLLDDKVLTAWNGMMIGAYAFGYEALGNEAYRRAATTGARFVLERLRRPDGGLARSWRSGEMGGKGYLEDYAWLTQGLLDLHRATGEERWLRAARELADQMVARFWDGEGGGFFFSEGGSDLLVRGKNAQDGALPAANAVAVHCLLDLAGRTGREEYLDRARQTLRAFGGMMRAQPSGFTHMVAAAERYLREFATPEEGGVALFLNEPAAAAARIDSLVKMRVAISTREPGSGTHLEVAAHLQIREGWHINANPTAVEWQIPTSMTLNADRQVDLLGVDYPPGTELFFASTGDTLQVYAGEVVLRGGLRLPAQAVEGFVEELRLLIRYQACNSASCLPPTELVRRVRLETGGP